MPPALIAFDLDGLLVDTEPLYFEAHASVFAEYGVTITAEEYARRWIIRGDRTESIAPEKGITADTRAMTAEAKRRFRALVDRDLRRMPGALEAVQRASRIAPTALVTNTPDADARLVTDRAGLSPYLRHFITRERYDRAKPAPDAYLAAAAAAGISPKDGLALEDSPRGARAAVAAGFRCVWVPTTWTNLDGPPEGIRRTVPSLDAVRFDAPD
jgi:HAD superfamily hydrolase (TIGR01509 family)